MDDALSRCKNHSETTLEQLRIVLKPIVPDDEIVLTCGSYARREASAQSDIDFFVITRAGGGTALEEPGIAPTWMDDVRQVIQRIVSVEPSPGGAFAKVENDRAMLANIGGDQDTNQKLTRRMLFLLEGEPLFNAQGLRRFRVEILERYINDKITDHQLALFLLNDIIRYYRTVATDYEFKTSEGSKPWGIRNIKLVFSRKLLYASGLFSVAATADRVRDRKVRFLADLFEIPVIDRMIDICGKAQMNNVLKSYNYFLEQFESNEVRAQLEQLKREDRSTDVVFRDLKNEGHHFTRELLKLFENTFDSTHPIRRAVIF
ncbi:putative nucleotidyltransferase [Methylobacterium sp. BE186]|uniref:nucleotidyltransferase domain-containing protein n=1 Tax=Methylobacterium sp. BE186 TaxID=2817715 RepID=UPI0028674BFF|nr:nucleotidyltransferase domain-containing protein [Methylobacterium sp. BE186]MDR7039025.1 putative nucleotidyltransferase [Methylobacterium sp. BE186]